MRAHHTKETTMLDERRVLLRVPDGSEREYRFGTASYAGAVQAARNWYPEATVVRVNKPVPLRDQYGVETGGHKWVEEQAAAEAKP
jgi:hypothetical protein